jgi:hypothetical protein
VDRGFFFFFFLIFGHPQWQTWLRHGGRKGGGGGVHTPSYLHSNFCSNQFLANTMNTKFWHSC